jgi:5'-3' exonuclease
MALLPPQKTPGGEPPAWANPSKERTLVRGLGAKTPLELLQNKRELLFNLLRPLEQMYEQLQKTPEKKDAGGNKLLLIAKERLRVVKEDILKCSLLCLRLGVQ